MNLAKKDKQIIVMFLGVLLIFLSIYFVFLPTREKVDKQKAENQKFELRVNELEQMEAQAEYYETEIEEARRRIEAVYADYQVDFRPEDAFMLGKALEEYSDNMRVMQIIVDLPAVVYDPMETPAEETVDQAGTSAQEPAVAVQDDASRPVLYDKKLTLGHECTAQGVKDLIDYINLNTNKLTIDNISVAYNETTGTLIGKTIVDVYLLHNTGRAYEPWPIPQVNKGTDNVFGTIELPENNE